MDREEARLILASAAVLRTLARRLASRLANIADPAERARTIELAYERAAARLESSIAHRLKDVAAPAHEQRMQRRSRTSRAPACTHRTRRTR